MPDVFLFKKRCRGASRGLLRILALAAGCFLMAFGLACLLSGCAPFALNAPLASQAAPTVTLDGKSLDKLSSFSGTVKADLATRGSGVSANKTLALRSLCLFDFLGGWNIWSFAGGLLVFAGILGAVLALFKAPTIGWRASAVSAVTGGVVLGCVALLKLYWGYLLGIFCAGLFWLGLEWALHHQGTLKKLAASIVPPPPKA